MDKIEIKVEVNGKQVPISDISEETLCKIRKADVLEKIPFVRSARSGYTVAPDRILLRVTESVKNAIAKGSRILVISLRDGSLQRDRKNEDLAECYDDIQDLTPKD